MKIEIEVPDEELKAALLKVVAERLVGNYAEDSGKYRRTISDCVREIIYQDKGNIVDRVVDQASRECTKKSVRKIMDALK